MRCAMWSTSEHRRCSSGCRRQEGLEAALTKELAEVREQIAALQSQLDAPSSTQLSRAEMQATLVARINAWHARAGERVSEDLQQLAAGNSASLLGPADAMGYPVPTEVMLLEHIDDSRAWLTFAIGKTELLARFKPLVDQMPEGLNGPARAKQRSDIEAQIVQAEVREEALIRDAEAQGIDVDPRPGQRAEAAILIGYGGTR